MSGERSRSHPTTISRAGRRARVAVLVLVGAGFALLGDPTHAEDEPFAVALKNHRFEPEIVRVTPGQSIRFHNADDVLHSLTLIGRENVIGEEFIDPGQSYTVRIPEDLLPGTYELACTIHIDMRAQLAVNGD